MAATGHTCAPKRRTRQRARTPGVFSSLSSPFDNDELLGDVCSYLCPIERVLIQCVSTRLEVAARSAVARGDTEVEVTVAFAGPNWDVTGRLAGEDDGPPVLATFCRASCVTFRAADAAFTRFERDEPGDFEFDAEQCVPPLAALGPARKVSVHGAASAAEIRSLFRRRRRRGAVARRNHGASKSETLCLSRDAGRDDDDDDARGGGNDALELELCNGTVDVDEWPADAVDAVPDEVLERVTALTWWNPAQPISSAIRLAARAPRLEVLTLALHGSEFDGQPCRLGDLAVLDALPALRELAIVATAHVVPEFVRPSDEDDADEDESVFDRNPFLGGETARRADAWVFQTPAALAALGRGLEALRRLRTLALREFHSALDRAPAMMPAMVEGAIFVGRLLACLPHLEHLSLLPSNSAFWNALRDFRLLCLRDDDDARRRREAEALRDASLGRATTITTIAPLAKIWTRGPILQIDVAADYPYVSDLNALVDCLVDGFPGRGLHLDLRVDVLVFDDSEEDLVLYETDIDAASLTTALARFGEMRTTSLPSRAGSRRPPRMLTLETNIPDLDRKAFAAAMAASGVVLTGVTLFDRAES